MRMSLILAVSFLCGGHAFPVDCNALILEVIKRMPAGGVYARYRHEESGEARFAHLYRTVDDLAAALTMNPAGSIEVNPSRAKDFSFCSSATYLVFCEVISSLQAKGVIGSDPLIIRELLDIGDSQSVIQGKKDGIGIFGHWNADGPGTAVLFERIDLGSNFSDLEKAKPGDFLKIFWNDAIGKGERGHLVIYLGRDTESGALQVWSSNLANQDGSSGYGSMWVERSRIVRAVFSRLERPGNIRNWLSFSDAQKKSDYLVGIRQVPSSESEMKVATGMEESPQNQ